MDEHLATLLTSYAELNSSQIDILSEAPSPLEFMRFVARNRPFVVRGGVKHWEAVRTWNAETLKEILKGESVNVAVTPNGRADAPTYWRPTEKSEAQLLFAKPCEEDEPFEEFIDYILKQEKALRLNTMADVGEIRYAQTQNDNLRAEYSTLYRAVDRDISWARVALEQEPDAINLWIGNSLSVSAMHRDNYENIYCQVLGKKQFVLLPPIAAPCVAETDLIPASWTRKGQRDNGLETGMMLELEDGDKVPFPIWDPDSPNVNVTSFSHLAEPIRVSLEPGDMLYLPAMWYHKVSQSCLDEGLCVAVNYWYDMSFEGAFVPLCDLVRNVARRIPPG